jgi:hypothetical protein
VIITAIVLAFFKQILSLNKIKVLWFLIANDMHDPLPNVVIDVKDSTECKFYESITLFTDCSK